MRELQTYIYLYFFLEYDSWSHHYCYIRLTFPQDFHEAFGDKIVFLFCSTNNPAGDKP